MCPPGRVDARLNDSSAPNPHCTQFFLATRHGSGDQEKLVNPPSLVLVRRYCIEKATRVSRISAPMASALCTPTAASQVRFLISFCVEVSFEARDHGLNN